MRNIADALKPYGFEWLLSVTGIAGPGSIVVVFAGPGDFYTACLTHDNKVAWVMSCGMSEVDGNTEEFNELCAATRRTFSPAAPAPSTEMPECTCEASTEGKWADVHDARCPAVAHVKTDEQAIDSAWERHKAAGTPDWPPAGSAVGLPDGAPGRGSTGQTWEVKSEQWVRLF